MAVKAMKLQFLLKPYNLKVKYGTYPLLDPFFSAFNLTNIVKGKTA